MILLYSYHFRLEYYLILLFFFSSRRRHTRFDCDWSSDVCSSDLIGRAHVFFSSRRRHMRFDCDWSSDVCSSDLSGARLAVQGRAYVRGLAPCGVGPSGRATPCPGTQSSNVRTALYSESRSTGSFPAARISMTI